MKRISKIRKIGAIAIIFISIFIYYWKIILKGEVPFPGDLLVGAYFPWLDYKWGYNPGVPVKNPLISDIFSQFYLWKDFAITSFRSGQVPLWNPYSYSGYPLLANFSSGVFNPMNLIMLAINGSSGWSWMIIGTSLSSALSMFFYLKVMKKGDLPSVLGALIYAFGGFPMCWSQFGNGSSIMIWIPLIFLSIETWRKTENKLYLILVAPLLAFAVFSGHFQGMVYTYLLAIAYFIYRLPNKKDSASWLNFTLSILLSVGLSLPQLLPTIELMGRSIRFGEGYIGQYNYGLLPSGNLFTLFAPDFFGNPTTGNFWGFFNYHETIIYNGLFSLIAIIYFLFNYKKLGNNKFFFWITIFGIILIFDNPIGRFIYKIGLPGLSTSAAGRISLIITLGSSVISAELLDSLILRKIDNSRHLVLLFMFVAEVVLMSLFIKFSYTHSGLATYLDEPIKIISIAIRNCAVPAILLSALTIAFLTSRYFPNLGIFIIILLTILDLFRFGWKYTPFVKSDLVFPKVEVTDYVARDKEVFRVERERGEILSPNTWMAYGLMSPSGYDPLAVKNYVQNYEVDINGSMNPSLSSRYSELERYDAVNLGKYNVKYLFVLLRDKLGRMGGDQINYRVQLKDWDKVYQYGSVAVLKNKEYLPRVRIVDDEGKIIKDSEATIESYNANKIKIKIKNTSGSRLLLADTFYPGWKAYKNGIETEVSDSLKPFRNVSINKGEIGEVTFIYEPDSFKFGLHGAALSLVTLGYFILRKH